MTTIDPMQQALLGQIGRSRGNDPRRSLAASLVRLSPPPAPINNSGSGLAYALTQGLNGFVGGRMMRDADDSEQAREAQAFDRYSNFITQQRQAQATELEAARNPPAAIPASMPQPMPQAPMPAAQPSPAMAGPVRAPADIGRYIEEASAATGIPVEILTAKIRQESNFNPLARGRAGEIGLAQIMPSTARQPGFGMQPVDPEALRDPRANVMFGAQYLRARAGEGVDWNNPEHVDRAFRAYNGGGDPNYVPNVRRWMPQGEQAAPGGAAPAGGVAPQAQPQLDALNIEIERVGRVAATGNPMAQTYLQELRDRRGMMIAQQGRMDQQSFQAQQAAEAQRAREAQAQQQREFQAEQARQAAADRTAQAELQARLAREGREAERGRLSPAEITLREETEDRLAGTVSARNALTEALRLSPQAFAGPLAELRGRAVGVTGMDPATASATTQFGSIMTEQALSQLRSIFGGNPTEGERRILIDMQASPSMSRIEREDLINRALAAVRTREAAARARLDEVVSGQYGRVRQPGETGSPTQQAAGAPVQVRTPEEAARLPRGTRIILPDGSEGVVP